MLVGNSSIRQPIEQFEKLVVGSGLREIERNEAHTVGSGIAATIANLLALRKSCRKEGLPGTAWS